MGQNKSENLETQYLASLPSNSQISGTKTTFTHLNSFLKENNLTLKDLSQPHNRDLFKTYLKSKVPNSSSRKTYWSFFTQFYSWLETEYLKVESLKVEPASKEPTTTGSDLELFLHRFLGGSLTASVITFLENEKQKGETLEDTFQAFWYDRMIREGLIQPTKEEFKERIKEDRFHPSDLESFDCAKLCKKFPQCTSNARGYLGEIDANNCFLTRFPTKCPYQLWLENRANDPHNPYPKCIAKQNLIPIGLPKDRIIRDPQTCWTCVTQRKKEREQKQRESKYRGQPRVNWGDDIPSSAWSGDW